MSYRPFAYSFFGMTGMPYVWGESPLERIYRESDSEPQVSYREVWDEGSRGAKSWLDEQKLGIRQFEWASWPKTTNPIDRRNSQGVDLTSKRGKICDLSREVSLTKQ